MIIGLGNDIVDVRRIEGMYIEFKEQFLLRSFTEDEQKQLKMYLDRYGETKLFFQKIANTWAAKESVIKAFGAEIGMKDFSVLRAENGAPYVLLHDNVDEITRLKSQYINLHCLITMSDEYPYCTATCVVCVENKI